MIAKKEVRYSKSGVKIGNGKYHPVELIVYKNDLYALKKIPKHTIDKKKRIDHLKNEKSICLMLQNVAELPDFFIRLEETFIDSDSVNFIFEFHKRRTDLWFIN